MHAEQPDDRSLAEQLRAVPTPPRLVERLREKLMPSDEQLDARLRDVQTPVSLIIQLCQIPEDVELDDELVAVEIPAGLVAKVKQLPVDLRLAGRKSLWQKRLATWSAAAALTWLVLVSAGGSFSWWFHDMVSQFPGPQREQIVVLNAPMQIVAHTAPVEQQAENVTFKPEHAKFVAYDPDEEGDLSRGLSIEYPVDPPAESIGPVGDWFASVQSGMKPWANVWQLRLGLLGTPADNRDDIFLEQTTFLNSHGIEPPMVPGYDRKFWRKHHLFPPLSPSQPDFARLSLPLQSDPANFDYLEQQALSHRKANVREVRVEDFVAHALGFVPAARTGEIEVDLAAGPSKFGPKDTRMLQCIVKAGAAVSKRPTHIVIALDLSSSMRQHWPEIQRTLAMLPERLGPEDRLSLVAYGEEVQVALDALTSSDWPMWREEIARLEPSGAANLAEGLRESLTKAFDSTNLPGDPQKEVLFISDHEGTWDHDSLQALGDLLDEARSAGVQTTMIDLAPPPAAGHRTCLQSLAFAGEVERYGNVETGPRDERQSPLLSWQQIRFPPIGSEVQLSMEFNPQAVAAYRLVGHDAGSWSVISHQAEPVEFRPGDARSVLIELAFKPEKIDEIGRLNLQWRNPADGELVERQVRVTRGQFAPSFAETPVSFQRSVCAAQIAEILRGSRQALREVNWTGPEQHDLNNVLDVLRKSSTELRNDPNTVRLIRAAEEWRRLSNR